LPQAREVNPYQEASPRADARPVPLSRLARGLAIPIREMAEANAKALRIREMFTLSYDPLV
jgi:hypothetical protein